MSMGRRDFFQIIFQLLGIALVIGRPFNGLAKPKARKVLVCWDGGDEVLVRSSV